MKTGTACPQTEELQKLLDGSLSGDRQQECTNHIDSCTGCQAKLENIAVDGTNLSQVVEHLPDGQPVADSAYWPALQALKLNIATENGDVVEELKQTFVPQTTARVRDASLAFLEPATDAAYLG